MTIPLAEKLADLLTLERVGETVFRSQFNKANITGEIFGGQYLGQAIVAASSTAPELTPQTLTGYFLRAADSGLPLDVIVEHTRGGRRFAHRRVTVSQSGKEVFRAEVGLFAPETRHPHHQRPMPSAPDPSTLKSLDELACERRDFLGDLPVGRILNKSFYDVYPVDPDIGMGRAADRPAMLHWVRLMPGQDHGPVSRYAILAYLSDNMANMASRAMHVANGYDNSLSALSLNHSLWFHEPPKVDGWLLFDLDSHYAGAGVGSNRGFIHGADGSLHASFMQDAMVRFP